MTGDRTAFPDHAGIDLHPGLRDEIVIQEAFTDERDHVLITGGQIAEVTGVDADVLQIQVVEASDGPQERSVAAEHDHALGTGRRAVVLIRAAADGPLFVQMLFDQIPQGKAFIPGGIAVKIKAFHLRLLIPAFSH